LISRTFQNQTDFPEHSKSGKIKKKFMPFKQVW